MIPETTPDKPSIRPETVGIRANIQARRRRMGEWVVERLLMLVSIAVLLAMALLVTSLLKEALPIFFPSSIGVDGQQVSFWTLLLGDAGFPTHGQSARFGLLAPILGLVTISLAAAVLAVPIAVACAVALAELAPPIVRKVARPALTLLAAIPAAVYGIIGLTIVNPALAGVRNLSPGLMCLVGAGLLACMALPTILAVAETALASVPEAMREGSLLLGVSRLATIRHAVLPAARRGLLLAALLGLGRALGEAMAVLMLAGDSRGLPMAWVGEHSLAFMQRLAPLVTAGFGLAHRSALVPPPTLDSGTAHAGTDTHVLLATGALLGVISCSVLLVNRLARRKSL